MATRELTYYSAYTFGAGTWPSGSTATYCISNSNTNNGDYRRYYVGLSNGRARIQFTTPNDASIDKITKVVFKFAPDEEFYPKYARGFLSAQKTTSSDTDYITASQVISTSYVYADENKATVRSHTSVISYSASTFSYLVFSGLNLAKNTTYYIYINMYASNYGETATSIGSNSSTGDFRARAYDNTTTASSYRSILTITYNEKQVAVTFNGNNATSNTFGTQTYTYGKSGQTFVGSISRTGYTMLGWSTSSTATTATYGTNSGVSDSWISSNSPSVTLYAVWKINQHTLTLNKGTGVASFVVKGTTNTTATVDYNTNVYTTATASTGYRLTQYTGPATDGTQTTWTSCNGLATDDNYWLMTRDRTITVSAAENTYKVAYNLNGGAFSVAYDTVTNDGTWWKLWNPKSLNVPYTSAHANVIAKGTTSPGTSGANSYFLVQNPTKTGYTFNGWTISGHNTSTATVWTTSGVLVSSLTNGSIKNVNFVRMTPTNGATVTFTANWSAKEYTLTVNPNGGTLPSDIPSTGVLSPKLVYNARNWWKINACTPTRTGYTLKGWYTATSGGTKVYEADGSCVPGTSYWKGASSSDAVWGYDGNLTVYAQWTCNTYRVAYDLNGGDFGAQWKWDVIWKEIPAANPAQTWRIVDPLNTNIPYDQPPQAVIDAATADTTTPNGGANRWILINNPYRPGYKFTGWTISGFDPATAEVVVNSQGVKLSTLTNGTIMENNFATLTPVNGAFVTFTANWEIQSTAYIWNGTEWKLALPYIYKKFT